MSDEARAVRRLEAAEARVSAALRGEPAVVRAVAGLAVWFAAMDELPPKQRLEGLLAALGDMRQMLNEAAGERTH